MVEQLQRNHTVLVSNPVHWARIYFRLLFYKWPAPRFLDSLVGRASAAQSHGPGFESRSISMDLFQATNYKWPAPISLDSSDGRASAANWHGHWVSDMPRNANEYRSTQISKSITNCAHSLLTQIQHQSCFGIQTINVTRSAWVGACLSHTSPMSQPLLVSFYF